jgi:hypothetical protein
MKCTIGHSGFPFSRYFKVCNVHPSLLLETGSKAGKC